MKSNKEKHDADVKNVLKDDGLPPHLLDAFHKYENGTSTSLEELRKDLGMGSWAVRLAYNGDFGGVVIQQHPGEGNTKHYHSDADENWVILDGEGKWWIDGVGERTVKKGDIIIVPQGVLHQITCVGQLPGARYAITKPDVDHIYLDE